jgi:hypothetical protein
MMEINVIQDMYNIYLSFKILCDVNSDRIYIS